MSQWPRGLVSVGGLAANDGHVGFAGGWTTATTQSGGGSPELRQRRRIDAPRAPGGSPCPCASRGTNGRCGGGRGSPELSPRRRPEFGPARRGGCSALAREQRIASGPWEPGEHAGATGASGRAPGREVRRQWRWPEPGACGDGGYGTGTSRKGGGKRRRSYGGPGDQHGRLGDGLGAANRRRRGPATGGEEDGNCVASVPPGSRDSPERSRSR